jgi:hypothetical protein
LATVREIPPVIQWLSNGYLPEIPIVLPAIIPPEDTKSKVNTCRCVGH